MKMITAAQFKEFVENDQAWASKLTEPFEITDYCNMGGSSITRLSHLIHFTGRNEDGFVASFKNCKNLKVAEGTFTGGVDFSECGIEQIDPEKLIITHPSNEGKAANFKGCPHLKIAQGTFPGFVSFSASGIERIDPEKLIITHPCNEGSTADFSQCANLKIAQGTFPGSVSFSTSGIERIDPEKLIIIQPDNKGIAAFFSTCQNLKIAQGTFPGSVSFYGVPGFRYSGIEQIGNLMVKPSKSGTTAKFDYCLKITPASLRETPMASLKSLTQGKVTGIDLNQEIIRRQKFDNYLE